MGKPKNLKARSEILKAASRLLCEYGYNQTSYAAIAQSVGCSKALVQQYFPQKSMFILDFNECLRSCAIDFFREHHMQQKEKEIDTFIIGQIYYGSYISPYLRHLFRDVISNRDLMRMIEEHNNEWMLGYLNTYRELITQQVKYSLINSIGGLYEVLYYFVANNETDYSLIMPFMINSNHNFFKYTRTSSEITKTKIKRYQMKPKLLDEAIKHVVSRITKGMAFGLDMSPGADV